MSTRSTDVGLDHPTVVPANFDAEEADALATDEHDADESETDES